ncbi:unnamed protein product [Blepharisma stoltei]|uniref:Uncharacterized protein n=1 Tax=Blepharisma stoltei TaxID=1481888 RepID=A0AAU9K1B5_9CILI|nr:unnamed protein product [Blepharisma stoltei]
MDLEVDFHEELRNTYEKTLQLAVNISNNKVEIFNANLRGTDIKFIKSIAKEYNDFKDIHDKYMKLRPKTIERSRFSRPKTPEIASETDSGSLLPRHAGKSRLNVSLDEAQAMVNQTKAGKPISLNGSSDDTKPSLMLKKFQQSNSVSFDTADEETKKLPYVSILSGKVEPPLELPSYKDYIKSHQGYSKKEPMKETSIQRIDRCQQVLADLSKEMAGLEMFCKSNPGVPWNNDKKILLKLSTNPSKRLAIIRAYNERFQSSAVSKDLKSSGGRGRRNSKPLRAPSFTPGRVYTQESAYESPSNKRVLSQTPVFISEMPIIEELRPKSSMREQPLGEDPEVLVQRCSSRFKKTQDSENKKLIQIIEKLKNDRPGIRKQKAAIIIKENEKYKDKMHSLNIFDGIKRKIESERSSIMKKNRSQVSVYGAMLTYLKKRETNPTPLELSFMEAIKEYLENGAVITLNTLKDLLQSLESDEKNELLPILMIAKPHLEFSDSEFRSIFA